MTRLKAHFILLFSVLAIGCTLQKENRMNRGLQNLTARYNIIFNSNNLISQREDELALAYVDRYDDFLRVFPDTGGCADPKIPDSVINKARKIIADKSQSNYVAEAYFLLGQASYLKCDYYNAIEYFDYVYHLFPKEKTLGISARSWKARTLMMSGNTRPVNALLDSTARLNDTLKHPDPLVYETRLMWALQEGDYVLAENMAQKALGGKLIKRQEWRLRFLLAQLQEVNRKKQDAYANYAKIQHSNAPFEMAFNASLNKIRIEDEAAGRKIDRVTRLLQLLKDDKNRDFQDQIYYQIAQLRQAEKKYAEAKKYYELAIKTSTKNVVQKGLANLRLAELSINPDGNYIAAGEYYENALAVLPKSYPGYALIRKRAQNLQFISAKSALISREDTLQMLARLPEEQRNARIAQIVEGQVKKEQIQSTGTFTGFAENESGTLQTQVTAVGSFYFDNPGAVSQGFSAFKRRWGDRKLADNWRSSARGAPELVPAPTIAQDPDDVTSLQLPPGVLPASQSLDQVRAGYLNDLPVNPGLLQQSNARIIGAYLDLANYYRDELLDTAEAIKTYQTLLNRFPDYADKPSVYYNLYRLNQEKNPAKSAQYRDTLTRQFPQSQYTQVINDPEYFNKMNRANAAVISSYEKVYDAYAGKNYPLAVQQADGFNGQMPATVFSPQVAYLRAIAIGHQQKLGGFEAALKDIVTRYPDDRLIVPLVKQHLVYIDSNRTLLAKRPVAIMDKDPNEPPFIEPVDASFANENPQPAFPAKPETPQPAIAKTPEKTPAKEAPQVNKPPVNPPVAGAPATVPVNSTPFSLAESNNYYFVVNVASASVNLSSSRFGIGQFNRANFQGDNIRHQLKTIGNSNQLIYVGRFLSLDAVKDYARNIAPLMPEIMKVPKEQYSFFIITQENLDKLADKNLLQQYMGFYETNFLK